MRLRRVHVLHALALALAVVPATAHGGEFALMRWLRAEDPRVRETVSYSGPARAEGFGLPGMPLGQTVGFPGTVYGGCQGGVSYLQAAAPSSYYVSSYGGCTGGVVSGFTAAPAFQQTLAFNAAPQVFQVAAPLQFVSAPAVQASYTVPTAVSTCTSTAGLVLPNSSVVQSLQRTQQVLQTVQPGVTVTSTASYPMTNEELTTAVQALTKAVEALTAISARHETALNKLREAKPPD